MKRSLLLLILLITIIPCFAEAEQNIGRITEITGVVKKTNINCEKGACGNRWDDVYPDERIITGTNSKSSIILDDGTAIILYENSDILIEKVRLSGKEKPTTINFEYGRAKIIQKNSYLDTSLVIKTAVAIIKSVNAGLSVVTATDETALFVYKGEAGFANASPPVVEAFLLAGGDESFVSKDSPPSRPVKVSAVLRGSWINRHFVSADRKKILKYGKKGSVADWLFINNE